MRAQSLTPDTVKDYSDKIYRQSQRLISLVYDILKLSQIEEMKMKPSEDVKLSEIIAECGDLLDSTAAERKIVISDSVSEEKAVRGSRTLLRELICNLLDNAIRYNKNGGSVYVRLRLSEEREIVEIEDTGIGIPEKDQSHVFGRFYRVDKSRSRETGGTGLGLSIVRHAASCHNAEISMKSTLGRGTMIAVSFPL